MIRSNFCDIIPALVPGARLYGRGHAGRLFDRDRQSRLFSSARDFHAGFHCRAAHHRRQPVLSASGRAAFYSRRPFDERLRNHAAPSDARHHTCRVDAWRSGTDQLAIVCPDGRHFRFRCGGCGHAVARSRPADDQGRLFARVHRRASVNWRPDHRDHPAKPWSHSLRVSRRSLDRTAVHRRYRAGCDADDCADDRHRLGVAKARLQADQ